MLNHDIDYIIHCYTYQFNMDVSFIQMKDIKCNKSLSDTFLLLFKTEPIMYREMISRISDKLPSILVDYYEIMPLIDDYIEYVMQDLN